MNANWNDIVKYIFCEIITKNNVNNFNDFHKSLVNLTNEEKGLYFEYFCYLFFKLDPITHENYPNFYFYNQIPIRLKKLTNVPSKDMGIDCLAIDKENKIYTIQVKFRSKINTVIPFNELSTFPALTFGSKTKNFYKGIFFSNCYDVCDQLKDNKYIHILFGSLNEKCDELFWKNVKDYIGDKPITQYKLKMPLDHQNIIIEKCKEHYKNNNYGKLYLACGTGKTFVGYWLSIRVLKMNKIFVVVPSLYLLSQTYETWYKEMQYDEEKYDFLLIGSDLDKNDEMICEHNLTTNEKTIQNCLKNNNKILVITTYHSSHLLVNACKKLKYKFDFGIYDEAHRSAGYEDKRFTILLSSKIEIKRLFMTATEKIYNYSKNNEENILSMDNENIYGKIIFKYSIKQAIDNDVLVNYRLLAPFINTSEYNEKILNDRFVKYKKENITYDIKTILIGLMIIFSMKKYNFTHLLIFSNTNEKAKKMMDFIKLYLDESEPEHKINCKYLSGNDNMNKRKYEVEEFENSQRGIISSARIFGEGVDIKICDSVCFTDGKSSSIDIVQYVGRCLRKCNSIPNKLSYVLIPFLLDNETEFFDYANQSYLKLRKILKTIGTTDELITEKIILLDCNNDENIKKTNEKQDECIIKNIKNTFDIEQFKNELTLKVFDKSGDEIDTLRNKIIFENLSRYKNNEELINTQKKCIQFLKKNGIHDEPQNVKNWIKYCLGENLFDKIKNNYYDSIDEFKIACEKCNITNFESYKKFYKQDNKLPPSDFINNGFYYYINDKFNLTEILTKNENNYDF